MARKVKVNPRAMMLKAIEVMNHSVGESRGDGKVSPKVGAVLWKPDGTVETACRGELRDGDHAEFTLLERKQRSERLDGSILFATLEPCAPGARQNPKLACAQRIVLELAGRLGPVADGAGGAGGAGLLAGLPGSAASAAR